MPEKAVVLLSGGLDSATALAVAKNDGCECYCLSFRYGQRHEVELDAAAKVAESIDCRESRVIDIDLAAFGGSALTADIAVPKGRDEKEMAAHIPVTYVPARNTIFLSYALGWAEVLDARRIYLGVNAVDYSGYPDCRPEFIAAYQQAVNVGTKAGVNGQFFCIRTPLIGMTKREIILAGRAVGCDYSLSISCYQADSHGLACGACDSCLIRMKGFQDAGVPDPTQYRIR